MKRVCLYLCLMVLFSAQPAWGLELTILHVNDSHSYLESTGDKLTPDGEKTYVQLGAWARLTTAVDHARREGGNVALLHAGDVVQGGLYFTQYGGKPEMEFLDRLRFDAMVLGNHEFDKGPDFLAGFLKYTHIPVLSANMNAAGVPDLAARVRPYTILNMEGEKVGIIGLTLAETSFVSSPGPGITFSSEAETARTYVKELEAHGVNKIILLTHVGLENDKLLAAEVPGVDVIVGGHSHSLIAAEGELKPLGMQVDGDYPVVVKGAEGNDVYVVTAWKWGRVLGKLHVNFDDAGNVIGVRGAPVMLVADDFQRKDAEGKKVALDGESRQQVIETFSQNPVANVVAEDAPAAEFLAPYSKGVQAMLKDVIGRAVKSLPHISVPGVTESGVSLPNGSLLAPLVVQSLLDKIDTTGERVDFALMNGGGVRMSLERGKITVGQVHMLLPFGNTIYTMDITGVELKRALEYGVTRGGGAFPYMSGAQYTADMNQPDGERITSVTVQGVPLNLQQTYRMVTNAYLANGGDGYALFKNAKNRYDTGFIVAQAFMAYVKEKKKLSPLPVTGVTYIPVKQ